MAAARVAQVAAVYFGLVFGVGFALGPVRVLVLEPRVGARAAELIEAPLMLVAVLCAARWIGRRWCAGFGAAARLGVGLGAAALVLAADLAVGVGLRGMTVWEVFAGRDPVSGSVYYALVALTAVGPWLAGRPGASGRPE